MTREIGFEFPLDSSGQWDGFNVPGMEHFAGNPLEHLGREVVQNSLDARISPEHPARVSFSLIEVPIVKVPGVNELRTALRSCAEAAVSEKSKKGVQFFEAADATLSKPKLKILQISDSMTTGVAGPCVNGRPYYALMKATGQSLKSSTDATGSFGIGKFAPFTVSNLRTVFVTSVWQDEEGRLRHYVQGKSVLMSHWDHKGGVRRGTGFWGVRENCMPVEDRDAVPEWLRRGNGRSFDENCRGTTLHILGFGAQKNWQQILTATIVENFFGAIRRGHLEAEIDGRIVIRRDTLSEIFEDTEIENAIADQKGEPEKFRYARDYLRALGDSSEVNVEESQQLHLGACELRILVGEGLPKRVAVLRNGMFITDELSRLRSFPNFKEFVAVVECTSEKGNELLRAMEPPRHDDFEPDRLAQEDRRKGRVALSELTKWVREMLHRHATDPVSDVTRIDELADYFADESDEGQNGNREEDPSGAIIIRARRLPPKDKRNRSDQPSGNGSDPGESEGEAEGLAGGRPGDSNESTGGSPSGSGGGDSAVGSKTIMSLTNVRAIPLTPRVRRVAFTPTCTGNIRLQLQDSGADTNRKLSVLSSTLGSVQNGEIIGIMAVAGERVVLEVELENKFEGTLKVVADAI